jgi:hypothetical protein
VETGKIKIPRVLNKKEKKKATLKIKNIGPAEWLKRWSDTRKMLAQ